MGWRWGGGLKVGGGEKGIVVGDKELSRVGGGHVKKVPGNNLMARI
jgi:hypothetical protein